MRGSTWNFRAIPRRTYDALKLVDTDLTPEVQHRATVVRTIVMGSSDGQTRHERDQHRCGNYCAGGHGKLGRIMDVLGNPVDEAWARSVPNVKAAPFTNLAAEIRRALCGHGNRWKPALK